MAAVSSSSSTPTTRAARTRANVVLPNDTMITTASGGTAVITTTSTTTTIAAAATHEQKQRPSSSSSPSTVSSVPSTTPRTTASSSTTPIISYTALRSASSGAFGVVYHAQESTTGDIVAIKQVLQDRRFKNREVMIHSELHHPHIIPLRRMFRTRHERNESSVDEKGASSTTVVYDDYINLVMDYVPDNLYRVIRTYARAKKRVPYPLVKLWMYQLVRAVAYLHSLGICHRDIQAANVLLDVKTNMVKLCDFGSAKRLVVGEPNVSYICGLRYRAPELIFESQDYTHAMDIWSIGCVLGEALTGGAMFPGDTSMDQLVEIIRVLGTPSQSDIMAMNPRHAAVRMPQITPRSFATVLPKTTPSDAIDLLERILRFNPTTRLDAFQVLCHPFFDDLRSHDYQFTDIKHRAVPPNLCTNWTADELMAIAKHSPEIIVKLCPPSSPSSSSSSPSSSSSAVAAAVASSSSSSARGGGAP